MSKNLSMFFVVSLLFINISLGQDRTGQLGIVFLEDFSSKPLNYGFSFWTSNTFSIELIGGFESMEIQDNSGTLYNFGLGGMYHFNKRKLVPFIGARFLYSNLSNNNKSYSDFVVGIVFGAEYFFSDWISWDWVDSSLS